MTIIVNRYWLDHIWAPVGEGVDEVELVNADIHCREVFDLVVDLIGGYVLERMPAIVRERVKDTWRYAVAHFDDARLRGSFESVLPVFDPGDIRALYRNVWAALFPDEPIEVRADESFRDLNDMSVDPWFDQ